MATRKKKYISGNNMPFLNKELSSTHKKECNQEIVTSKTDLVKIKGFILNNKIFVFLYYKKLKKKALWQFKSQGHS